MKQISDDIFEFFQIQSAITIWVRFLWRNVKLDFNDNDKIDSISKTDISQWTVTFLYQQTVQLHSPLL